MEFELFDFKLNAPGALARSVLGMCRCHLPAAKAVLCTPQVQFMVQNCLVQCNSAWRARCDNRCSYRTCSIRQLRYVSVAWNY